MGYRVILRKDSRTLQITGKHPVTGERIRQSPKSDSLALAREEATNLEAEHLRESWYGGPRRGTKLFAEAVEIYITDSDPSASDLKRLQRITAIIGPRPLSAIDQNTIDELRGKILRPGVSPATVKRGVITPIRAVLTKAAKRGWCDRPAFDIPREMKGRVRFLLPGEAWRLTTAASPHIRVLVTFLLGTGARMSEALDLDWREVDLTGAQAIFLDTKGGAPRIADLSPALVAVLGNLPHREGRVFLNNLGLPYSDRRREGGGQERVGRDIAARPPRQSDAARSAAHLGDLALRDTQGSDAAARRGRLVERDAG
jgi:integrase